MDEEKRSQRFAKFNKGGRGGYYSYFCRCIWDKRIVYLNIITETHLIFVKVSQNQIISLSLLRYPNTYVCSACTGFLFERQARKK